jgi:hypothetical protein
MLHVRSGCTQLLWPAVRHVSSDMQELHAAYVMMLDGSHFTGACVAGCADVAMPARTGALPRAAGAD